MTDKPSPALDLSALRIQPTADLIPTERVYTVVAIRKPAASEFVRTSADPANRFPCLVYKDGDDRDAVFVIHPAVINTAGIEIPARRVELRLATNRAGVPFLWPISLPDPSGRSNAWHTSAAEAAQLAETRWVRMSASMAAGHYNVVVASSDIPDPDWAGLPAFDELLRTATRGRVVDTPDHLVIRRLRGEV